MVKLGGVEYLDSVAFTMTSAIKEDVLVIM